MDNKWDIRFLKLAQLVGSWSKDPNKQCGAVIVRPDNSIAGVGYNGFPKGMQDTSGLLLDRAEKNLRMIHAEVNAYTFAALSGSVTGYTIYVHPCGPCPPCAVQLIQWGIKRFVFPRLPESSKRFIEIEKSKSIFTEMGLLYTEYQEGIVEGWR